MTAIETTQLRKRYGDEVALDGLELSVGSGEVFGFLGPNGAGKSTTINLLLDFVRPTGGHATVLGYDAHEESRAVRARTGVLAEDIDLYGRLSGRRHLELAIEWSEGAEDPETLLERVGLDEEAANRPVSECSKGMTQRIALGMALAGDPELLILDEPSTGLDPNGIRMMRELVREEAAGGTAVFFSSHDLSQVEAVCDRVAILDEGKLVAVDMVDGLREAIGAHTELRLRLSAPPRIDIDALDGITTTRFEDGILRVTCDRPRAKAHVVGRLLEAGQEIMDVDAESVSLEDVFTAYTNGETTGDDPFDAPQSLAGTGVSA